MRAFRIGDARYPVLDGEGARQSGGRWNSPGSPLVYAAETFAGSMLEVLIHMNRLKLPKNRIYVKLSIKDSLIATVMAKEVRGWDASDQIASRACGDEWLSDLRSLGLLVPSLATRGVESNLLINPLHPDFGSIRATDPKVVVWNGRLFENEVARRPRFREAQLLLCDSPRWTEKSALRRS